MSALAYLVSDEVVTAPAAEPVEVYEFKGHSRIDYDGDDPLIEQYLRAAREHVEALTGRALITQTREARYRRWSASWIELPSPLVQSVASIKYLDRDRVEQTLSAAAYYVDRLSLEWGSAIVVQPVTGWPDVRDDAHDPIRVRYVCGFGASPEDVPESIRHAIRLLAAHWYEHREAVAAAVSFDALPLGVSALIEPWRYRRAML